MRSYTELQSEFDTKAKRAKCTEAEKERGRAVYIAANFLKDNNIEFAEGKQQALEALKNYPAGEQVAFSQSLELYFETLDAITERLKGGR